MSSLMQSVRDSLYYSSGYVKGRGVPWPSSLSALYGSVVAKITRLVSLPLPFLSFLALPFFGNTSTTLTVAFFYLTWSALVLSHDQLTVELYGTLIVRMLCFLLPALGFLAFDLAAPRLSKTLKSRGVRQLPTVLRRKKLLEVAGFAIFNVLLAIAVQAVIELLFTVVLRTKSVLKVTSVVPFPWNILKDVAKGFAMRGVLIYLVHRYLLHTYDSPLKTWHLQWQHSVRLPFSLVAAYDHPVNYLLLHWLPTFVPAYLFRFHVLTWHFFIALCSLEELFVFSGYSVLPSTIILLGMARRNDEHFDVVYEGDVVGNFGRTGVLDFCCGTSCQGEDDAMDDIQKEVEKHQVQERAEGALNGAVSGFKAKGKAKQSSRNRSKKS
jgi:hypothetical protein